MTLIKPTLIGLIIAWLFFCVSGCQTSSLESTPDIYLCGTNTEGPFGACYWKNQLQTNLSSVDNLDGWGEAICIANNVVYVAGYSRNSSMVMVPCYWNNGTRTDLNVIDAHQDGNCNSLIVSGHDVYTAGFCCNTIDGVDNYVPCYWKNGQRTDLAEAGVCCGICVVGSDLYIAGYTGKNRDTAIPCYWKNGIRTDLDLQGWGEALVICGTDVYVAGNHNVTNEGTTVSIPCYWKNGVRTDLSVADATLGGAGLALCVSGNNVYVAGKVWTSDKLYSPCYWVNGMRTDLEQWGVASAISVYAGDVYVAGFVIIPASSTNDLNFACYWKNGIRTDMFSIIFGRSFGIAMYVAGK